jgi:multidrug efflux pump subunit AcrA (membrane-fusion protein)
MADEGEQTPIETQSNAGKWILTLLALAFVAVSGYTHYVMHTAVQKLSADLTANQAEVKELQNRMQTAEAQEETLARQAGMTKKELAQRTAELQAAQRAAESRLEEQQNQQKQQISEVTGDINGVKTDVGGVKTDVASTKADLEATKAKLQTAVGDLTGQSELIATTRADLELLKHKGDRNYYEFTLLRGAKPQPVSTVSLQLRKADAKHGRFTLNVTSDDKTIEKKDRNISEPIQFYSGRDHLLFELVVWSVDKNKATGYLSTPKNAPVPVTASSTTSN